MKDEMKKLKEQLKKEPRWCYKCNNLIVVLMVDKRPTFVCPKCQEIMDGYIKEEQNLALALQGDITIKRFNISSIIQDVRVYNPLDAENQKQQEKIEELEKSNKAWQELYTNKTNEMIKMAQRIQWLNDQVMKYIAELKQLKQDVDKAKRDRETETCMREAQRDELHIVHKQLERLREAAKELLHYRLVLGAINYSKANILWEKLKQALAEVK